MNAAQPWERGTLAPLGPPPGALLAAEATTPLQASTLWAAWPRLVAQAPRGDGHPVLVLPGLGMTDMLTAPLRVFLATIGHSVFGFGAGLVRGDWQVFDEHLVPRLEALHRAHGRRVSVVGWSMGGVYARALALVRPAAVRRVVSIAGLLVADAKASNVWPLYERLSGEPAPTATLDGALQRPLPMPSTVVYSRIDGIVDWRGCLQPTDERSENVEVRASHHALGTDPRLYALLAERLARPEAR